MRGFALPERIGRPKMPAPSHAKVGRASDRAELEAEASSAAGGESPRLSSRASLDSMPKAVTDRELFPQAGQALDPTPRRQMESRFRFDFSRVRIHQDEAAERNAYGLSARAFTLGREIGFGKGQYAPHTADGERLLAHELAHVVQQAGDPAPLIRRSPNLPGANRFGEGDAPRIDKVIAASAVTKYVPAKDLKTLEANVDEELPTVFAEQYRKYGQSEDDVDSVPGFVNRAEDKPIKLRAPGANDQGKQVVPSNFEAAVHETVHLNSKTDFQNAFGHPYNEGVTEYFTDNVLGEPGSAYRDQFDLANGLVKQFGEKLVGEAYFLGKPDLFHQVIQTFGTANQAHDFRDWHKKATSKDPADWKLANSLLASAVKKGSSGATTPPTTKSTTPAKADPSKS